MILPTSAAGKKPPRPPSRKTTTGRVLMLVPPTRGKGTGGRVEISALQMFSRLQQLFSSAKFYMETLLEVPYFQDRFGKYRIRFSIRFDENAKESRLEAGISKVELRQGSIGCPIDDLVTFVIAECDFQFPARLAEVMDMLMTDHINSHPKLSLSQATVHYKGTMLERWHGNEGSRGSRDESILAQIQRALTA
jgi:hypothetical protein